MWTSMTLFSVHAGRSDGGLSQADSRASPTGSEGAPAVPQPLRWSFEEDGSFSMRRKRRLMMG